MRTVSWIMAALLPGCGAYDWVDGNLVAKEAAIPARVELIYSANEDLSGLAWRVERDLPEEIGTVVLLVDGQPVDLSASGVPVVPDLPGVHGAMLAGHHQQIAFRLDPKLAKPAAFQPPVDNQEQDLDFTVEYLREGPALRVAIQDPFRSFQLGRLQRSFTVRLLDSTCSQVWSETITSDAVAILALPPVEIDRCCVQVDDGRSAWTQSFAMRPQLLLHHHQYWPPEEYLESIIVPIFDLDIPFPDRCSRAEQSILAALQAAAGGLPKTAIVTGPIELAERDGVACIRQVASQEQLLNQVILRLENVYLDGDPGVVVLFVLVTNANEVLAYAPQLINARSYAARRWGRSEVAMLGTQDAGGSLDFIRTDAWTYSADPNLPDLVAALLQAVLPYTRLNQDPWAVVPFFAPNISGVGYKICDANREIFPVADPVGAFYTFLPGETGYRFYWTTDFVPSFAFLPDPVQVLLEVCQRYCDNAGVNSWTQVPACWSTP